MTSEREPATGLETGDSELEAGNWKLATDMALRFAWLSLVRQPTRAVLGVLGVAAIGALLFDMLLLSRGLVVSFSGLLDESGYDIRIFATDAPPLTGPQLADATALAQRVAALPGVEAVLQVRVRGADMVLDDTESATADGAGAASEADEERGRMRVEFVGADRRGRSMWRIVHGHDLPERPGPTAALVVNQSLADRFGLSPGSTLLLSGRCRGQAAAVPPVRFTIVGIADFPFDSLRSRTVAGALRDAERLCGVEGADRAEMVLVRSSAETDPIVAAAAIRAARPDLHVVTNEELVERFSRVEFSYFRQISTVLATVTLFFGFLLITTLLTVSVNQRLGEIAVLRAVGLSRTRVIAGVVWESVLMVGTGGLLAVPLGLALSAWLETILAALPGVPADVRFFVFEPRALALHLALLTVGALAATAYPVRIVSVLPIAETLRREVVS